MYRCPLPPPPRPRHSPPTPRPRERSKCPHRHFRFSAPPSPLTRHRPPAAPYQTPNCRRGARARLLRRRPLPVRLAPAQRAPPFYGRQSGRGGGGRRSDW
eukprot:scaffold5946_cov114-Isochrysis_galbana.AAC.9